MWTRDCLHEDSKNRASFKQVLVFHGGKKSRTQLKICFPLPTKRSKRTERPRGEAIEKGEHYPERLIAMFAARPVRTFVLNRVSTQARGVALRRTWLSTESASKTTEAATSAAKEGAKEEAKSGGWWNSAQFWGGLGALAGWGMSGSAIYDASQQGPEVISLSMTPVLIVYSSLFARWAYIVKPQNLLLCACHVANVAAQSNQMRRALEHKISIGQEAQVNDMAQKAAVGGAVLAGSVLVGPSVRSALSNANLGIVSATAAADAGPFTVHFW